MFYKTGLFNSNLYRVFKNFVSMKLLFSIIFVSLLSFSIFSLSYGADSYLSPNKQLKQGVLPEDILCRDNLVLIIKSNGNPACVKEDHIFRFLQSGWADKVIPKKDSIPINPITSDTWNDQDNPVLDDSVSYSPNSVVVPPLERAPAPTSESSGSIGLAVGGAQDINNFRENIGNDFLPLHTDITYEGLFYDYYFDTGSVTQECEKLFCPSYSYAVSKDPFSDKDEYYLSVGLNSGLKESDFKRKNLNLVVVLDISGSMNSPFNDYYYDSFGNKITRDDFTDNDIKTKMQLANESVAGLIDHLNDEDNFGVVLFDGVSHLSKPLERMEYTDKDILKENILNIHSRGSTNMEAGMQLGTSLFDEFANVNSDEYENRIIFLTDAMPNTGNTSKQGLFGMISENSKNKIYTTFIGIGVDLNTELIEEITKTRGANYYSIHSASEFKNRMVDEFEFMVTPLVFNLLLSLDADGYDIKKVYGSPEADESTGQIMKVNTLFPSKTKDGQTKGGIVLLKLEKTSENSSLVLKTSYENRIGELDGEKITIELDSQESNYYENTGIQKGILLSRYAELMKTWVFDERMSQSGDIIEPLVYYESGIHVPDYVESKNLGQWERQSIPLQVTDQYETLIIEFNEYFNQEMTIIGDDTLQQEIDILNKLENY